MTDESQPKFRRRADARPDEILDAALALFIQKGFAQTRVDEIARAAGLSKGAVYLYFPSKEALLEGLVERAVLPVASDAAAQLAARDEHPRVTLARVMKAVARALEQDKTLAVPLLVIREAAALPRIAEIYRDHILLRLIPALTALIADGVKRGILRPTEPELAVRTVIGPMILHIMLAKVFGLAPKGGLDLDRMIDNHLEIIFRGLDTGPEGRG